MFFCIYSPYVGCCVDDYVRVCSFFSLMIHVASDKTLALKNIWERVFVFDVVLPSVGTLMEINPNFSLPISLFVVYYTLLGLYVDVECQNRQMKRNKVL